MDQQQQNHRPRTDSCLSHCSGRGGGCSNAFYWYQILVLDYGVVKAQQLFGLHGKINCFCYRYPGLWLSEKSINSPMQHLQNIISFNFLYLQKMICAKL